MLKPGRFSQWSQPFCSDVTQIRGRDCSVCRTWPCICSVRDLLETHAISLPSHLAGYCGLLVELQHQDGGLPEEEGGGGGGEQAGQQAVGGGGAGGAAPGPRQPHQSGPHPGPPPDCRHCCGLNRVGGPNTGSSLFVFVVLYLQLEPSKQNCLYRAAPLNTAVVITAWRRAAEKAGDSNE